MLEQLQEFCGVYWCSYPTPHTLLVQVDPKSVGTRLQIQRMRRTYKEPEGGGGTSSLGYRPSLDSSRSTSSYMLTGAPSSPAAAGGSPASSSTADSKSSVSNKGERVFLLEPIGEGLFNYKSKKKLKGHLLFLRCGGRGFVCGFELASVDPTEPRIAAQKISGLVDTSLPVFSTAEGSHRFSEYAGEYEMEVGEFQDRGHVVLVESLDCLHLQGRFETRSVEAELFWTERGECFRDMYGRLYSFFRDRTNQVTEMVIFSSVSELSEVWIRLSDRQKLEGFLPAVPLSTSSLAPGSSSSSGALHDSLSKIASILRDVLCGELDLLSLYSLETLSIPSDIELEEVFSFYASDGSLSLDRVQRLLRDVLLRLNLESVVRDMDRDATTIGLPQLVDLMDTDRDGIVGLEDFIHNWHHLCDAQILLCHPTSVKEALENEINRPFMMTFLERVGAVMEGQFLVEISGVKSLHGTSQWSQRVELAMRKFFENAHIASTVGVPGSLQKALVFRYTNRRGGVAPAADLFDDAIKHVDASLTSEHFNAFVKSSDFRRMVHSSLLHQNFSVQWGSRKVGEECAFTEYTAWKSSSVSAFARNHPTVVKEPTRTAATKSTSFVAVDMTSGVGISEHGRFSHSLLLE